MAHSALNVVHVLLIEDDPDDALMTQEAFEIHNIPNALHVVNDGVEAIRFLRREGEFATAPRPGLILLDLTMPRMDGREVLAEVKSDENLRSIPIVVLTTSEAEEDILRSYSLYANAYVTNARGFDCHGGITGTLRRLHRGGHRFWRRPQPGSRRQPTFSIFTLRMTSLPGS